MDVGELLSFQPNTEANTGGSFKRGSDSNNASAIKRAKTNDNHSQSDVGVEAGSSLDAVESSENDGATMDETMLKKLILGFEKKCLRNQELRIKFSEQPQKFMDSEVELHSAIQDMKIIATAPNLYTLLVSLKCVPSFLGLLSHDNTDISVAMVDLLQELTDIDTLNESEEGADALIQSLLQHQAPALLLSNLERLSDVERDESDGIHNTLSIFDNAGEYEPKVLKAAADAGILNWIVKKLKVRVPFDSNKLYASEMLSIFLQSDEAHRVTVGESGALDSLLQQLAYYKRHDPTSKEEEELMENLFDCICFLLLYTPNRERFLRAEGLQLMNLMLREKKLSRHGALKVLDHALNGAEGKELCAKFVDILGLRTIFPLFMKTPKKNKRKGVSAEEHEEHAIAIVASLIKNCRGSQRQRMLNKFVENDHEKIDRLMELHFKYVEKVNRTDRRLSCEDRNNEDDEDELYLHRLDGGLFHLQLIDYIILEASVSSGSSPSVKQRVHQILNQRGETINTIREVIREYAGNVGENSENGHDEDSARMERQYLISLVDKF